MDGGGRRNQLSHLGQFGTVIMAGGTTQHASEMAVALLGDPRTNQCLRSKRLRDRICSTSTGLAAGKSNGDASNDCIGSRPRNV